MRPDGKSRKVDDSSKIVAIDLFCGVGGLTHGLENAGIEVRLGIDIDPACCYPYETNNRAKFLPKSVDEIKAEDMLSVFPEKGIRLIAGCAPCQTFSRYNQKADPSDGRWFLLRHFSRLIEGVSPDLVTMENVPGLVKREVFKEFVEGLEGKDYHVHYDIVNCADYGVPQHRDRLVLLASKLGEIRIPEPSEFGEAPQTVRDAIEDLPPLAAGSVYDDDPLHQASSLSAMNLRRIRKSKPGGTWRDWPKELVADCHRKATGKTYPSVYGRMAWDEPGPTITTQFFGFGNGRFGHPVQDRALSLREGAILQTFPPDYEFVSSGGSIWKKQIGRLIGNAVPVKLGEMIGLAFLEHVRKSNKMPSSVMLQATS